MKKVYLSDIILLTWILIHILWNEEGSTRGYHAAIRTRILARIRMHEDECRTQAAACSTEREIQRAG